MLLKRLLSFSPHQLDVVTAFLNPTVNNEIYMDLPDRVDRLDPSLAATAGFVSLNKALYGLKQAPTL